MKLHFPKFSFIQHIFSKPILPRSSLPRLSPALRQLSRQRQKLSFSSPRGRLAKPAAITAALFLFSFFAGELAAYGVSAWQRHNPGQPAFSSITADSSSLHSQTNDPIRSQGKLTIYSASDEGNWGLSFQQEGKPPVANASMDYLAQFNAHYAQDTDEKVLYLTFDAGYENGNTEAILDALKKHGAPATFFLVGNYLETSPDLVKRMIAEGHNVGNHTFHHPDMSAISDQAAFQKELDSLAELYQETTGRELPHFYRPPQGKYSEENLKQAQALGYKTVFWSLAYVDWYTDNQPTAEQAYAKLLPRIHDGAIVLLHSTSQTNADILDELLTKWEDMGYRFASLEELPEN